MADSSTFTFGPGSGWASLIQFVDGTAPTIQQPRKFDVMQSMTINFDSTIKRLMGSQIFPRAIGISDGKVSVKIKLGRFDPGILNLRVAQTGQPTSGTVSMADDEAATIPATPFQVTTTNSATWTRDWGVRYAATGLPLTRVASGPATGQYSATAGVYTFAAADTTLGVLISYEYTVSGSGTTVTMNNQLQGNFGLLQLRYQGVYAGRKLGVYLPNFVTNTFNMDSKEGDFTIPELDGEAFADSTNIVANLYFPTI